MKLTLAGDLRLGCSVSGGAALGFKPKGNFDVEPATFPVEAKAAIDFRGSWNSRKFNWKPPSRKGSARGGTLSQCGAWTGGANCLSWDCSEFHPALSRLPGALLRWRFPNYCHSRPRSGEVSSVPIFQLRDGFIEARKACPPLSSSQPLYRCSCL